MALKSARKSTSESNGRRVDGVEAMIQQWRDAPPLIYLINALCTTSSIRAEDYCGFFVEQCAHVDRCSAAEWFDTNAIERLQRCDRCG